VKTGVPPRISGSEWTTLARFTLLMPLCYPKLGGLTTRRRSGGSGGSGGLIPGPTIIPRQSPSRVLDSGALNGHGHCHTHGTGHSLTAISEKSADRLST